MDICDPAHAFEGLFLEEPQQLGLERWNHVADFVDEHSPAIRCLEQAPFLRARVSEGSPLVTEQFAFEQVPGQHRTGEVHERARRTRSLA